MIRLPPRKILVAYDFSEPAARGWRQASALAKRLGAALELVHVRPWTQEIGGAHAPPAMTPAQARAIRARIRAAVGEGPAISVVEGDAAGRIVRQARAHRADLIVVGSHGRRGLARLLLGSVAEAVVRSSPVPVLVVRGPVIKDVRTILAPVHFTSYSNHGFAYAAGLAAALDGKVTALHVNTDPVWSGNPLMRMTRLIKQLPPALRARCETRVQTDEKPAHGILRAAARQDLIVLVAHEKPFFEDAFLGTTAERVLRSSKKMILTVPPPRPAAARHPALMAGVPTLI